MTASGHISLRTLSKNEIADLRRFGGYRERRSDPRKGATLVISRGVWFEGSRGREVTETARGGVMHLINSNGMYGAERVLVHMLLTLEEMGVQAAVLKEYQIWSMSREVKALEKRHLNGTKPIDVILEGYLNSFKNDLNDIILFLSSKRGWRHSKLLSGFDFSKEFARAS